MNPGSTPAPGSHERGMLGRIRQGAQHMALRLLGLQELQRFFPTTFGGGSLATATKPYEQVIALYRSVNLVARGVASLPVVLSTRDDQIIEAGPVVDLLAEPKPGVTGSDFLEQTVGWLLLTGAAYWIFEERKAGGVPATINVIGKPLMRELTDAEGNVTGYEYTVPGTGGQKKHILKPEEVWPLRLTAYDAQQPHKVIAPTRVVQEEANQLIKANVANNASLDNGVQPGGVFTMEGTPTDTQRDDVRKMLAERRGVQHRNKELLLWGGMKWQQMGAAFKDMDFVELRRINRNDVCVAIGVDPAAVGFFDGASDARSQSQAAKDGTWIDTIIPMAQWIGVNLTRAILLPYERDNAIRTREAMREARAGATAPTPWQRTRRPERVEVRRVVPQAQDVVWLDTSGVPAVRRAAFSLANEMRVWLESGIPLNQIIETSDLPFEEVPWGNTWWKPIGLVDVQEAELPGESDPNAPPSDEEVEENKSIWRRFGEEGAARWSDEALRLAVQEHERKALDESTLAKIWQHWRTSWASFEPSVRGRYVRHMRALQHEVLDKLERELPAAKTNAAPTIDRRELIDRLMFDVVVANKRLTAAVGPLLREALRLGGQQSLDEAAVAAGKKIDDADAFNLRDPDAEAALRRRTIRITDINRRTARRLRESLADGLSKGETHDELAERIRTQFRLETRKARTVAFQEVATAVEESRQIGREQAGVPMKSWLWSRKQDGRGNHGLTEVRTMAAPIANDARFTIAETGNTCDHPRNTGDPADDINCGCTTLARYPDDGVKDARLMAHLVQHGYTTYEQLVRRDAAASKRGKEADDDQAQQ